MNIIEEKLPQVQLAKTIDPSDPISGQATPPGDQFVGQKTYQPVKFIHLATHIHEHLFQVPFLIGGFYNWCKVFNSRIDYWWNYKGKLEQFDYIYVGIAQPEMATQMLYQIRKEIGWNSKTKLIAHIDYAVELWKDTFNLNQLAVELDQADFLFAGEPSGASAIKAITGRDVYLIPHPTNVDVLKRLVIPYEQRQNALVAIIHRYDNAYINPHLATRNLKSDIEIYAVVLDGNLGMLVMPYFHYIRSGGEYGEYIQFINKAKICLDSYMNLRTYGRLSVDNAALKVPTVGCKSQFLQSILFPNLTVEAGQHIKQRDLLERLCNDRAFYDECTNYAYERVDEYGYARSKQKFLDMLNGKGDYLKYIE